MGFRRDENAAGGEELGSSRPSKVSTVSSLSSSGLRVIDLSWAPDDSAGGICNSVQSTSRSGAVRWFRGGTCKTKRRRFALGPCEDRRLRDECGLDLGNSQRHE